jgi:hypothetical protein
MLNKSINRTPCENYLFEDYGLKSGITTWILGLRTSGSKEDVRKRFIGYTNSLTGTIFKGP